MAKLSRLVFVEAEVNAETHREQALRELEIGRRREYRIGTENHKRLHLSGVDVLHQIA